MSLTIVNTAMQKDFGTPCRKLVALCLANFADEKGKCWPSIHRIARCANVSERRAQTAIREFVDEGLITIEEGGAPRKTNWYRINLAALDRLPSCNERRAA